jgi:ferric-dicitrate binding protein FerR (iron transport regulator)
VLASVRGTGQGVTHRNALRPTVAAAAPAATRAAHEPLRALFADVQARRRRRWLALIVFVTLLALLLLFFTGALPAFAGRAQATAAPDPRAHRLVDAARPGTQWGEAGARQGIVPGEIACV